MSYICNDCGNLFAHPKGIANGGGDHGETLWTCPWCFGTNYSEGRHCPVCGNMVTSDEEDRKFPYVSACDDCVPAILDKARVALRKALTKEEHTALSEYIDDVDWGKYEDGTET